VHRLFWRPNLLRVVLCHICVTMGQCAIVSCVCSAHVSQSLNHTNHLYMSKRKTPCESTDKWGIKAVGDDTQCCHHHDQVASISRIHYATHWCVMIACFCVHKLYLKTQRAKNQKSSFSLDSKFKLGNPVQKLRSKCTYTQNLVVAK